MEERIFLFDEPPFQILPLDSWISNDYESAEIHRDDKNLIE